MLVAMIAMYLDAGTTDIDVLLVCTFGHERAAVPGGSADLAVAGLLRLVRGEDADVAGAHLVARCARSGADGGLGRAGAVLLKMGGYGFLRFSLPMFPVASRRVPAAHVVRCRSSPSSTPRWWRWCRPT
jgi:NADH-quinone oxidoreductase subunit M